MPYNALEWHVSVQMNVTKAGFSVSYIFLYTCGQPVPQRLISANVDNGTAAGIYALRRLKFKHFHSVCLIRVLGVKVSFLRED